MAFARRQRRKQPGEVSFPAFLLRCSVLYAPEQAGIPHKPSGVQAGIFQQIDI